MTTEYLWINEDNYVEFEGASDSADSSYLNSATVTWTLRDEDETQIATGSLSYVAASNGNYRGTIESTSASSANLTENSVYLVDIAGSQGAYNFFRRLRRKAKYRQET